MTRLFLVPAATVIGWMRAEEGWVGVMDLQSLSLITFRFTEIGRASCRERV